MDEQRVGPYKLWLHVHRLETVEEGTKMTDEIIYQMPFGILGSIAHVIFVRRTLHRIFDYRRRKLDELFPPFLNCTVIASFLQSFMTQNWEDLLLLHWPLPPEELSPTIPDDLSLDLFDGQAWASVVGFRLTNLRLSGLRAIPWSDFLEVNLRTYVRDREGRRGVWFHSLDSSDLPAVLGARILYGLRYFHSRISMQKRLESSHSNRGGDLLGGGATALLSRDFAARRKRFPLLLVPLDQFLLERYRFWARRKLCHRSSSAMVRHRPYDARIVEGGHYEGGCSELGNERTKRIPGGCSLLQRVFGHGFSSFLGVCHVGPANHK